MQTRIITTLIQMILLSGCGFDISTRLVIIDGKISSSKLENKFEVFTETHSEIYPDIIKNKVNNLLITEDKELTVIIDPRSSPYFITLIKSPKPVNIRYTQGSGYLRVGDQNISKIELVSGSNSNSVKAGTTTFTTKRKSTKKGDGQSFGISLKNVLRHTFTPKFNEQSNLFLELEIDGDLHQINATVEYKKKRNLIFRLPGYNR